ncbi:hypothetical protein ILUMI_21917 [Ignelater luminosus]|uniref:Tyr recombinase domain-containing protein n=1 Tax=Ignelater luminosus TaxID=2038154 RepID=A0A8K0FXN1_IGNLU|nr:hypothetical protein ILUMI_21917 [Ignelater luminosus]
MSLQPCLSETESLVLEHHRELHTAFGFKIECLVGAHAYQHPLRVRDTLIWHPTFKKSLFLTLITIQSYIRLPLTPEHDRSMGVFGLRSDKLRYDLTWASAIVLRYLKQQGNGSIFKQMLTCKLVTLLALATGQRVQTLANIEIRNIVRFANRVETKIPMRIKTSRKNRLQPLPSLLLYDEEPSICVAGSIFIYLRNFGNCDRFLLTFRKPYRNATTQSISRWIKRVPEEVVSLRRFLHTVRHAATFAVARKGLTINSIRLTAGWSNNSKTFANFTRDS